MGRKRSLPGEMYEKLGRAGQDYTRIKVSGGEFAERTDEELAALAAAHLTPECPGEYDADGPCQSCIAAADCIPE